MYYEHEVCVKMHITSLKDEVSESAIKKTFSNGHWDYEVTNTTLMTPVEVVAQLREELRINGLARYKHALGHPSNLVLEVLDDLKSRMEDYQTTYEEAL